MRGSRRGRSFLPIHVNSSRAPPFRLIVAPTILWPCARLRSRAYLPPDGEKRRLLRRQFEAGLNAVEKVFHFLADVLLPLKLRKHQFVAMAFHFLDRALPLNLVRN